MGTVLGKKIHARRLELGLLQRDLSEGALTPAYISQLEKGKATPSIETLNILAQRLNVPVTYLLDDGAELTNKAVNTANVGEIVHALSNLHNLMSEKRFADVIEAAETLSDHLNDMALSDYAFLCDYFKGIALYRNAEYNYSIFSLEKSLPELTSSTYREYCALANYYLSCAFYRISDIEQCERYSLTSLSLIEKYDLDLRDIRSRLMINLATCAGEKNNFYQAYEQFSNIISVAGKGLFSPDYIADAYRGISMCNLEIGNLNESMEYADKATHLYELVNDTFSLVLHKSTYGMIAYRRTEYTDAAAHFRKTAESLEGMGIPGEAATYRAWLSKSLAESGNLRDALQTGKAALKTAKQFQSPLAVAHARHALGMVYNKLRRPLRAIALLRRAAADMENTGSRNTLPEICQLLGNIYLERGNIEEAKKMMNKAMNLLLNKDLSIKKPVQ